MDNLEAKCREPSVDVRRGLQVQADASAAATGPAGVAEATATAAVTTTAITAIVKRLADRRAGLC